MLQESSDPGEHQPNSTAEAWREAIQDSVTGYVREHYPHGVCTVCLSCTYTVHV